MLISDVNYVNYGVNIMYRKRIYLMFQLTNKTRVKVFSDKIIMFFESYQHSRLRYFNIYFIQMCFIDIRILDLRNADVVSVIKHNIWTGFIGHSPR